MMNQIDIIRAHVESLKAIAPSDRNVMDARNCCMISSADDRISLCDNLLRFIDRVKTP